VSEYTRAEHMKGESLLPTISYVPELGRKLQEAAGNCVLGTAEVG
jgi:hypothetical protein